MARLSAEMEAWCAQPLRLLVSAFPRFVTAILGSVEQQSIPLGIQARSWIQVQYLFGEAKWCSGGGSTSTGICHNSTSEV